MSLTSTALSIQLEFNYYGRIILIVGSAKHYIDFYVLPKLGKVLRLFLKNIQSRTGTGGLYWR